MENAAECRLVIFIGPWSQYDALRARGDEVLADREPSFADAFRDDLVRLRGH
jgi:hypothetical protein